MKRSLKTLTGPGLSPNMSGSSCRAFFYSGMKEIFYIDDTSAGKISYYLLLVFVVTLPFDRLYSELSLIGLLLHTLLHPAKDRPLSFRWAGWLVSGLFLLMVVSSLYAPHYSDAGMQLEKQLAILLF